MKNLNNKRIVNAVSKEYNGIKFQSTLELSCYKKLAESGLDFSYESEKYILWEGCKLNNILVIAPKKIRPGKYGKDLEIQTSALRNITYTPDFIIKKGNYKIFIEVKGKENDVYPYKKKIFLKLLEEKNDGVNYIFLEPHNVRQILQAIDYIKKL